MRESVDNPVEKRRLITDSMASLAAKDLTITSSNIRVDRFKSRPKPKPLDDKVKALRINKQVHKRNSKSTNITGGCEIVEQPEQRIIVIDEGKK